MKKLLDKTVSRRTVLKTTAATGAVAFFVLW